MSTSFDIFITYSQIAIFDPSLQNPFNNWQPQHFAQGFAWRPGSVSFRTLDEDGLLRVEVQIVNEINLRSNTKRAILVPFSVGSSALVEVASISEGKQINVPKGSYALVFETGHGINGTTWCSFSFIPRDSVQVEILQADSDLSPSFPLLMEAHPACGHG